MCAALLGTRLVHHDLRRVIAAAGRSHEQAPQLRGEAGFTRALLSSRRPSVDLFRLTLRNVHLVERATQCAR